MNDADDVKSARLPPVWDAENDRFVRPLFCPHCEAPSPVVPDEEREACICGFCFRPFEVVRVDTGKGEGARAVYVARRAALAHCSTTGERLLGPSLLDWAGQGGSAARTGAVVDRRGLLYGEPTRDVAWDLEKLWVQARMGKEDGARADEIITSVSVWKGVVVVVTASGFTGLLDPFDGAPLLQHAITWPGVDLEDDDHARAVRLPPALQGTTLVLGSDRTLLIRDLAPSMVGAIFARSTSSPKLFHELPAEKFGPGQWIGAPLLAGDPPRVFAVHGVVGSGGVDGGVVIVVNADGVVEAEFDAAGIARAPVCAADDGVVVWVNAFGHVSSVAVDATNSAPETMAVTTSLPSQMLSLAPQEKPLLLIATDARGAGELWLADDSDGLKVWRAPLSKVLSTTTEWSWEPLLEAGDIGALRSLVVGAPTKAGAVAGKALSSQLFVLGSERSTAA